jgi:hypothetical protein
MDIESADGSESKNTKLIDSKFVVDMNQKLGGGSYSNVYTSWLRNNPTQQFACKIISKKDLDLQVTFILNRSPRKQANRRKK